MPRWVEPMPFIICVNSKVFMSHTLLVFCQIKIFNTATSSNARSEWKVMHWRSGSRPWTLCSCPWKWFRPSRKLLAKWLSNCMILSVFLKLIPYSYGFAHAVLIWYIWGKSISSASSIFGNVEVSTVIGQWPGSTSIMSYLRVLPPWYLGNVLPLHHILLTLLK